MLELLLLLYVIVATYYLKGILQTWDKVTRDDRTLRLFLKKCIPAKWFAGLLILIAAYMWPIGLVIRPFIKKMVQKYVAARR